MLDVGTQLKLVPYAAIDYFGRISTKPVPCKVVYVNKKHRYYTVEFQLENGVRFRESFKFEEE